MITYMPFKIVEKGKRVKCNYCGLSTNRYATDTFLCICKACTLRLKEAFAGFVWTS